MSEGAQRLRIVLHGAVQGVGFRPFAFRLAKELGLRGWISNSPQGVTIEVEGIHTQLCVYYDRLRNEKPANSFIQSSEVWWLDLVPYTDLEIRDSAAQGARTALILPDLATCSECVSEIWNPQNRRYRYPFTNCTHCGPRFSIITGLPYDRARTSMCGFEMCGQCKAEYTDPSNRRFHAQPNACPDCGPHLELWDTAGRRMSTRDSALQQAVAAILTGQILAVKGLGGFHLLTLAGSNESVPRLRLLKRREAKPLAVMFPTLDSVLSVCHVSSAEQDILSSPQMPIVLLRRRDDKPTQSVIAPEVAPENPYLGVLLPYTPLHHLLLGELKIPVVATSGNVSGEPICIDEFEAVERLRGIADLFLIHDRPIVRHVDDSIVRFVSGREMVLRRARGYAPLPIQVGSGCVPMPSVLATGAHLKSAVAFECDGQAFLSQHIGDLETSLAFDAFTRAINDLKGIYGQAPDIVAADLHPGYLSTQFALQLTTGKKSNSSPPVADLVQVQHHVAHVYSCMAENQLRPPVLGVSWDGTGFGPDGTVWGGEFIGVTEKGWSRLAHFRQFPLPGSEQAVKEPRRCALGVLFSVFGDRAFDNIPPDCKASFTKTELAAIRNMLGRSLNSPITSSVGRLFDAVASLSGLRNVSEFEGQAAMGLEFALENKAFETGYPFKIIDAPSPASAILDWAPMISALLADVARGVSVPIISARFHQFLTDATLAIAERMQIERVALTGGCFQNVRLAEATIAALERAGFRPYWHQRVPPNDGGICLGQVVAALVGKQ